MVCGQFSCLTQKKIQASLTLSQKGTIRLRIAGLKVINVSFDHPMHTLETAREPASNWPANQKSGFWPKNQHPGNPKRRNTWHPGFGNKASYQ